MAAEAGQTEPARQLLGRQPARQFQQRPRVAPRLGHDPVAHPLIERTRDDRVQQSLRIAISQPADREFRQSRQVLLVTGLAHCEDNRDWLGHQAARHKRERLRRGRVEPLCIVYDADQRPLLGHVRQQAHDGQADARSDPAVPALQAERRAHRVALRTGKAFEPIKERRAELMQPGERELCLRLRARRPRDVMTTRAFQQVSQQRGLAGPCLATQDQRLAMTRSHVRHQPIQCLALTSPATNTALGCPCGEQHRGPVGACRPGYLVAK